jgi:ABC-2 type transport system ATP-binding protein
MGTLTAHDTVTSGVRADGTGTAVVVEGLRKHYGDHTAVDGISFDVAAGEIFGLLGHNGAGKTTTVEILQGLRTRDTGRVSVLGLDPDQDPRRLRRLVGTQLQEAALPDRLRVGEALRLFAGLAGDVVDWRELLDRWDLGHLERSAFGTLSGGERQRLFIALALVNAPRLVFLDELTQGLDPSARRETWRHIERVREQGTTVVLVTHFMEEAERLCDRVGIVHDGRLIVCDTPPALVAQHGGAVETRFTADPTLALQALDDLDGAHVVQHRDRSITVTGDGRSPTFVAAALAGAGLVPDDLNVVRPTLEDAFLALTSGGTDR